MVILKTIKIDRKKPEHKNIEKQFCFKSKKKMCLKTEYTEENLTIKSQYSSKIYSC